MPRIEIALDAETATALQALAQQTSMTRTALLRLAVGRLVERNPVENAGGGKISSLRKDRLTIRLPQAVHAAVDQCARSGGMTRPGVVAAVLRAKFLGTPTLLEDESVVLAHAAFELGRIGVNLNQLVRQIHRYQQVDISNAIAQVQHAAARVADLRGAMDTFAERTTFRWLPGDVNEH